MFFLIITKWDMMWYSLLVCLIVLASETFSLGAALGPPTTGPRSQAAGPHSGLHFVPSRSSNRPLVAKRGKPFRLDCHVDSKLPRLNYTWYKCAANCTNYKPLRLDSRRHLLRLSAALFLTKVRARDAGFYICVVRSPFGNARSNTVRLLVSGFRGFRSHPVAQALPAGSTARFSCAAKGVEVDDFTDAQIYSWQKDGRPLPRFESKYKVLAAGVLQVRNVTLQDAGAYRCVVSDRHKSRYSKAARLSVTPAAASGRLLSQSSVNATELIVGGNATLECLRHGAAAQVAWQRTDGIPLNRARCYGDLFGNLVIQNARESDSGTYLCNGQGQGQGQGRALLHTVRLKVTEPPKLLYASSGFVEPVLAETVRLHCNFSGSPPLKITWLKNGDPLEMKGRIKVKNRLLRQELIVSLIEVGDAALYQCLGENSAGQAQNIFKVVVKKSVFAPEAPTGLHVLLRTPTSLTLEWDKVAETAGHAHLAYTVHWFRTLGNDKERSMVVKDLKCTISELQPFTNYTIYAMSYNMKSGSPHSQKITVVTAEDVPIALPESTVTAIGATSLKVRWEKLSSAHARGRVSHYVISYRLRGALNIVTEEVDSRLQQHTIVGLKPSTQYDVRVDAATSVGRGRFHDDQGWITQSTLRQGSADIPAAPLMQWQPLNSTKGKVTWRLPVGVKVTGFKIKCYRVDGSNGGKAVEPSAEATSCVLNDLVPGAWYELALSYLVDDKLESEPAIKTIQMPLLEGSRQPASDTRGRGSETGSPVEKPPSAAPTLQGTALNQSCVRLQWSNHGDVHGYTLRYQPILANQELGHANTIQLLGSKRSTEVTGLEAYSWYEFELQSHSSSLPQNTGLESATLRLRTTEGYPTAPRNPAANVLGKDVQLRWQPPVQTNGVIIYYIILYSLDQASPQEKWEAKTKNGSTTQALVRDLQSNMLYYFRLRAATHAGYGQPSDVIRVKTSQGQAPGAEPASMDERTLGVLMGSTIGGCCIIITVLIIALRHKCCPYRRPLDATHVIYSPADVGSLPGEPDAAGDKIIHVRPSFIHAGPKNKYLEAEVCTHLMMSEVPESLNQNGVTISPPPDAICKDSSGITRTYDSYPPCNDCDVITNYSQRNHTSEYTTTTSSSPHLQQRQTDQPFVPLGAHDSSTIC